MKRVGNTTTQGRETTRTPKHGLPSAGVKYEGSKHYHLARAAGAVTDGLQCGHQHGACVRIFLF